MSRVYDFTVVGTITIISVVVHLMAVELFAPGGVLFELASTGTQNVNGAARAQLWFEILTIWVPIAAIGGISLWALIREYRRQVRTVAQRAVR